MNSRKSASTFSSPSVVALSPPNEEEDFGSVATTADANGLDAGLPLRDANDAAADWSEGAAATDDLDAPIAGSNPAPLPAAVALDE